MPKMMEPSQFRPDVCARGAKLRLELAIGEKTALPVLIARGTTAGSTLAITANIHGDEYEGVRAIFEIFEYLNPQQMTGDLIAVPVANPPAFWRGTRTSPVDGLNMARIFPGHAQGTLSEKIAHTLAHSIIDHADFYLDLHSGGIAYRMPMMVGYSLDDRRSRVAANIFGAPVIWGHSLIASGRTISYAQSRDIPWLYTEARGAGRIHRDDLEMMKHGIENLMRHLDILPGEIATPEIQWSLTGNGNTDDGIAATHAGFLLSRVDVLQDVVAGELLGSLVSPSGELIEEYRAAKPGVVALIHEFPVVQPGDSLFLLADREAQ